MEISDITLRDFININPDVEIGEMVVECGAAHQLLKTACETQRDNWSQLFYDRVLEGYPNGQYRIIYVPSYSYILYFQCSSSIQIWVAYTEPSHRKLGYMSLLLTELTKKCQLIEIDTPNKSLETLALKLGIKLFEAT